MADISALLDQSIFEPIDPNIVKETLNKSPFVPIPGVVNVRDLGGMPVVDPNTVSASSLRNTKVGDDSPNNWHNCQNDVNTGLVVRSGRLFRSAQFNSITPEGKAKLFELDVGAIFDFRTTMEIRREARLPQDADVKSGVPEFKRPKPAQDTTIGDATARDTDDFEEIKVYHNPLKDITQHAPQEMMKFLTRLNAGDEGLFEIYEEILTEGGRSFGNIMKFILEQAKKEASEDIVEGADSTIWRGRACVWNCHSKELCSISRAVIMLINVFNEVGKDRTGIFSALLLNVSVRYAHSPLSLTEYSSSVFPIL
jgi:hypothetical protein